MDLLASEAGEKAVPPAHKWVIARKPRENLEGGVYHVYARGNAREPVYRNDRDRRLYLQLLGQVVRRMRWRCLAYCLMDNHLHLVLETPHGNLSRGMQRLHGGYAQAFNDRHDRVGHVFQGRYGAVRIESPEQLVTAVAYVARNPVEAGLCLRPEKWPWSSFRAVVEPHARAPDWLDVQRLLWHFGPPSETAVQRYAQITTLERALGGAVSKGV